MTEEELRKNLNKLEKGESVTMEVNGQTITYINPPEPTPVCTTHYYIEVGHGEAKCRDCINGTIFDPGTHGVEDGKIVRL